jgi:two-component system invasion response regulator UvrY
VWNNKNGTDSTIIKNPTKIMLVDDHALVRCGMRRLLEELKKVEIVAEASSGEEALQLAHATRPNLILMDFDMPGMSGLETTPRLLRSLPKTKIIIVSAFAHEAIILRLLRLGASGFISKGAHVNEMIYAINMVNNGGCYVNEKLITHVIASQQEDPTLALFNSLSNKELLITLLVAQAYNNKQIAERLHLSTKTISTYRSSSYKKLGVKNEVELTLKAIKYQLVELELV